MSVESLHRMRITALGVLPSCLFPDFSASQRRNPFTRAEEWIRRSNAPRLVTAAVCALYDSRRRGLDGSQASPSCLFPDFSGRGAAS